MRLVGVARLYEVMGEHATFEQGEQHHDAAPKHDHAQVEGIDPLIARAKSSPREAARIAKEHPQHQGAIFRALHAVLGNAYVQEVLDEMTAPEHDDITSVMNGQNRADSKPAVQDPDVEELLKKTPTSARGPDGAAAWLLRAAELGFLTTGQAKPQLQQFKKDEPEIHAIDNISEEADKDDRKQHPGRFDHIRRNPKGGYEVTLADSSILPHLVTVVRSGIEAWKVAGGKKPKILALGDYVRADIGFGGNMNSPHKEGDAMDLYLQKSGTQDAIDLLSKLPPGQLTVFLDNPSALHIDKRPGGFGLGLPTGNGYVSNELAMQRDAPWRCPAQDRLEREAGDDHSKPLETLGVNTHLAKVFHSTAKWDGTRWVWSNWAKSGVEHESLIIDPKLRQAIADYRTRSKTKKP